MKLSDLGWLICWQEPFRLSRAAMKTSGTLEELPAYLRAHERTAFICEAAREGQKNGTQGRRCVQRRVRFGAELFALTTQSIDSKNLGRFQYFHLSE